jgi:quercetin dioxygenase-like cupin family protein
VQTQIRAESAPPWTSPAPGVRVRPLVEGSGTALMLYQIEPGTRFEVHSHPFPELGLVLSGEGVMLACQDQRRIVSGDSYYYPSSVEHGFFVPKDSGPVLLLDVSAVAEGKTPPSLAEMVARLKTQWVAPGR